MCVCVRRFDVGSRFMWGGGRARRVKTGLESVSIC